MTKEQTKREEMQSSAWYLWVSVLAGGYSLVRSEWSKLERAQRLLPLAEEQAGAQPSDVRTLRTRHVLWGALALGLPRIWQRLSDWGLTLQEKVERTRSGVWIQNELWKATAPVRREATLWGKAGLAVERRGAELLGRVAKAAQAPKAGSPSEALKELAREQGAVQGRPEVPPLTLTPPSAPVEEKTPPEPPGP